MSKVRNIRPLTIAELRQRAAEGQLTPQDLQQISWLRTARRFREHQGPAERLTRDIAEYIRAYRENNKMTVKEFAARCNVQPAFISQIETGYHRTITLPTLIKLATGCSKEIKLIFQEPKRAKLRKVA